MKADRTAYGVW